MAFRNLFKAGFALASACALAQPTTPTQNRVVTVDRVVAVINDEAITQYDLEDAKRIVLQQLKQQNVQPPAQDVLEKQVLERMLTERSLLQFAKENGVRVDDTMIERAILRIAQDNKLSAEDFRKVLAKENIAYPRYREDIRNELTVQRLREREVDSKITVSDTEVDQYLATLKGQNAGEAEYKVAHILVLVPEQASAEQIDARKQRAEERCRFRPGRGRIFRRKRCAKGGRSRLALGRTSADGIQRGSPGDEGRPDFGNHTQRGRISYRQAARQAQP